MCLSTSKPTSDAGSDSPTRRTSSRPKRSAYRWTPGLALPVPPSPSLDANTLADRAVTIAGDPDSCIRAIQQYQEIGVDEVMMIIQTETIPHDKVMSSIELFGKEVFPVIREMEKSKAVATAD